MSRLPSALRAVTVSATLGLVLGGLVPVVTASPAAAHEQRCRQSSPAELVACRARLAQQKAGTAVAPVVSRRVAPTVQEPVAPAPAPAPVTVAPAPAPAPVPVTSAPALAEVFGGPDGVFAQQQDFWGTSDRGLSRNASWFAESGTLLRQSGTGRTTSPVFRMWTRSTALAHTQADLSVRFNGWTGGTDAWHGINLWMNAGLCTPFPSCSAVNDGGNSGYALDFLNRDGSLTILKKVPGDTRASSPNGAIDYSYGGTYYWMTSTTWRPEPGRTYRFTGRVVDNGNGSSTIEVLVDGAVKLRVVDDGRMGGPRLTGGRVGLRSDYVDMTVDDLTVTR